MNRQPFCCSHGLSSTEASETDRRTFSPHNTKFFDSGVFSCCWTTHLIWGLFSSLSHFTDLLGLWMGDTPTGKVLGQSSDMGILSLLFPSVICLCEPSHRAVDPTYAVEARNDGWYRLSASSHSHFWVLTHGRCNLTSFSSCLWTFRPLVWFSLSRKCI